jgi:PAS domain S-box-containing protein
VIVTDSAGRIAFVNEAAARLHGVAELDVPPEGYSAAYHLFTEDGRPHPPEELPLARALLRGETVVDARWRIRRPDGTEVLAIGSAGPLHAADGAPMGAVLTVRDDTARESAERALRESEAKFRTLADNIPTLCWMAEADGWIFWYNRRWHEHTGTTPAEMEGWGWRSVHEPAVLPSVLERWRGSIASGEPFEMVFPLRGADGTFRPFLTRVAPIRDGAGRIVRWFGTNTDITERIAAEEQQRLLLQELSHRVKNTLAVVQGIAARSLTGDRTPQEARDVFTRRLRSLADAHGLLTASEWRGASLAKLVEDKLRPFGARATLAGPDAWIGPRATLTLGLVLHELATNALKHGSLAAPEGRVEVAWQVDGAVGELRLR